MNIHKTKGRKLAGMLVFSFRVDWGGIKRKQLKGDQKKRKQRWTDKIQHKVYT